MKIYLYLFFALFFSCTSSSKKDSIHQGKRQGLVSLKDVDMLFGERIADSITIGTELEAKIFLTQPDYKIEKVFMQCNSIAEASIDTVTLEVTGCINELIITDDTIRISFKPTVLGKHEFPEFNILISDNHRKFSLHRYSFSYNVLGRR